MSPDQPPTAQRVASALSTLSREAGEPARLLGSGHLDESEQLFGVFQIGSRQLIALVSSETGDLTNATWRDAVPLDDAGRLIRFVRTLEQAPGRLPEDLPFSPDLIGEVLRYPAPTKP